MQDFFKPRKLEPTKINESTIFKYYVKEKLKLNKHNMQKKKKKAEKDGMHIPLHF